MEKETERARKSSCYKEQEQRKQRAAPPKLTINSYNLIIKMDPIVGALGTDIIPFCSFFFFKRNIMVWQQAYPATMSR